MRTRHFWLPNHGDAHTFVVIKVQRLCSKVCASWAISGKGKKGRLRNWMFFFRKFFSTEIRIKKQSWIFAENKKNQIPILGTSVGRVNTFHPVDCEIMLTVTSENIFWNLIIIQHILGPTRKETPKPNKFKTDDDEDFTRDRATEEGGMFYTVIHYVTE